MTYKDAFPCILYFLCQNCWDCHFFFNRQNSNVVVRCYALKNNVFKCGTSNEDLKKAM